MPAVSSCLAPGTSFVEDSFSMDWERGWFGDDSSVSHLLCTLFLLLLHQVHLRSSGIRFQRLETPDLGIVWVPRHLLMKSTGEFCPSLAIRSRAGWPEGRAEQSGLAPPPWLPAKCRARAASPCPQDHSLRWWRWGSYFLLRFTFHLSTTYLFPLSFVLE